MRAAHELPHALCTLPFMDDLETAWAEIHDATPPGWVIGLPAYEARLEVPWSMYAFDPSERPKVGRRTRGWTAIGPTEVAVVRDMARCLRGISEGRRPR